MSAPDVDPLRFGGAVASNVVSIDQRPVDPATDGAAAERERPTNPVGWIGWTVDRVSDRIDAVQRRVPLLAVLHGVLKKFGEDRGGQLAMLLTYRGFFALFPLLLVFVNVMGLVLRDNPGLQADLVDSTLASIPIIGPQIRTGAADLGGSWAVIVVSSLVSLWAGLGLLEMIQESLNTVWGIPVFDRPNWIIRRLRSLPAAAIIICCLVLSGSRAWAFRWAPEGVGTAAMVVAPLFAGSLCAIGLHVTLCSRRVPVLWLLPGALFVGASWLALQLLGVWYVDRFIVRSSETYGVFVVFFGLLSWTYLLGMLYLYGLELSSVLFDRRWPRSLTGRNLTDEDQVAFAAASEREVRVRGTDITIAVPRQPADG